MLGHQTGERLRGEISTPGEGSDCRTKAPSKELVPVNLGPGPI
jgi:hypothetical protein